MRHRPVHPLLLLWGSLSAFALLELPAAWPQEAKPAPEWKAKFHVDFRGGDPKNSNVRPVREGNFRWETGGARITMPAGAGKLKTAGVAANFQIKGDFEITASYEILKADQPTEGYGVGVSLFVAIEPEALDAVSLARRVGVKGSVNFLSDRMTPTDAKVVHVIKTRASKAAAGKLRIQRTGSAARFFIADGDNADFVPIYQDAKAKTIEAAFDTGDIRYFQIGGDAGDSEAALDLRLLDLVVFADELPGLIERPNANANAKKEEPAWMKKARESQAGTPAAASGTSVWLMAVLGSGAGLALLVGLGIGAFVWLRRRSRAVSAKKPDPRQSATASFVCSHCGVKLKAKAEAVGKKLRCSGCRKPVLVPAPAAEREEPQRGGNP